MLDPASQRPPVTLLSAAPPGNREGRSLAVIDPAAKRAMPGPLLIRDRPDAG